MVIKEGVYFSVVDNCYFLSVSTQFYYGGHKHQILKGNEPPHDKTNAMACASSEDSDQPGHPPSDQSLRCPHKEHEESLGSELLTFLLMNVFIALKGSHF